MSDSNDKNKIINNIFDSVDQRNPELFMRNLECIIQQAYELNIQKIYEHKFNAYKTQTKLEIKDEVKDSLRDELATKADLRAEAKTIRAEMSEIKSSIESDIKILQNSIYNLNKKFDFVLSLGIILLLLFNPVVAELIRKFM